jgi:hypothetical protein
LDDLGDAGVVPDGQVADAILGSSSMKAVAAAAEIERSDVPFLGSSASPARELGTWDALGVL